MSKRPLWEVMYDAWCKTTDPLISDQAAVEHGTAAEIRALRDWIEKRQVDEYGATLPDVREVIGWLTTEADRAENIKHD